MLENHDKLKEAAAKENFAEKGIDMAFAANDDQCFGGTNQEETKPARVTAPTSIKC